ncbi:MAG: hypothetical protein R3E02_00475 [Blastomonas sp.]
MLKGSRKSVLAIALGVGAAAMIPSMGSAFSTGFDANPVSIDARGGIGSFTPASVDPRLVSSLKFNALRDGKMFRFTPAGTDSRGKRAMTIAVRMGPESASAINVRPQLASAPGKAVPAVQITEAAFSLGAAKGFQKFALPISQRSESAMPDIAKLGEGAKGKESRFSPRIEMDGDTTPGSRNRAFGDQGNYSVDVGGSYKLTRNLDVTAGIRLKSERDRLDPLTNEQFDSQAVFVGTEFRF